MLNDHCHWVSTHLQSINIIIIIIIICLRGVVFNGVQDNLTYKH